jgi:glycosyltransferase involved in cell wall biosynthesis
MELYAGHLGAGLETLGYQVQVHTPHLPSRGGRGPWTLRFSRYVGYPWQSRRTAADVHHIVDQSYAHLLYTLDPARTVVTVHDVMPILRWRGRIPSVSPGRRPWLNLLSAHAMKRAARLIAVSEKTRLDLIDLCDGDAAKITVIYQGIEDTYRVLSPAERIRARQRWNLPSDGTLRVLMVGSVYYKNQRVALRAFASLRSSLGSNVELVGVGTSSEVWTDTIRRLDLGSSVREVGPVGRDQMVEIYNCVDLLLFPSLYEGFGRPPLEAMACGIPVVSSNAGALPEAVGDAALTCDPQDEDGLASRMRMVLCDAALRNTLVERGLAQCKRFTWDDAARQTEAVYRTLAEH